MQDFDRAKLRAHRRTEAEKKFPLLRGCPSTSAIARLAWLDALGEAERMALADQLSDLDDAQSANPQAPFEAALRALPLVAGFLAARRQPAQAASPAEFVPVAQRRLRRLVDETMTERFAASATRVASDHTRYAGTFRDASLTVDILFAHGARSMHQVAHHFGGRTQDGRVVWMKSYEGIWRLPPQWDRLTETSAAPSVAHLATLIEICAGLV